MEQDFFSKIGLKILIIQRKVVSRLVQQLWTTELNLLSRQSGSFGDTYDEYTSQDSQ